MGLVGKTYLIGVAAMNAILVCIVIICESLVRRGKITHPISSKIQLASVIVTNIILLIGIIIAITMQKGDYAV